MRSPHNLKMVILDPHSGNCALLEYSLVFLQIKYLDSCIFSKYYIPPEEIECLNIYTYETNFLLLNSREMYSIFHDLLCILESSKFSIPCQNKQSRMLTISIFCQTEVVIRRRHFLNRAVGQGWRYHSLNVTTKFMIVICNHAETC